MLWIKTWSAYRSYREPIITSSCTFLPFFFTPLQPPNAFPSQSISHSAIERFQCIANPSFIYLCMRSWLSVKVAGNFFYFFFVKRVVKVMISPLYQALPRFLEELCDFLNFFNVYFCIFLKIYFSLIFVIDAVVLLSLTNQGMCRCCHINHH